MNTPRVPIENVYYLLCYAWKRLEGLQLGPAGSTPGEHAETLLTNVLCAAAERALMRGVQRNYIEQREDLRSPRGKFDLTSTFSRGLESRRGIVCDVAELRIDTPLNRLLKTTLVRATGCKRVANAVRRRARRLLPRLSDVSLVPYDTKLIRQLMLHRNVSHYWLIVEICSLLWTHAFPTEQGQERRFADFIADEQAMGRLFEQFVTSFLEIEYPDIRVIARRLNWSATGGAADLKWLPKLEMDIPIQWQKHRTVVECKFCRSPWARHFGKRTIVSSHLQQLHSYLENDFRERGARAHGVLLYAVGRDAVRLDFELCGYPVSVRTLGLEQAWGGIDADLRALIAEWSNAQLGTTGVGPDFNRETLSDASGL